MTAPVPISEHAYQRAKQRFGLTRAQVDRRALDVYANGRRLEEQPGPVRDYLQRQQEFRFGSVFRIVNGRDVWVFRLNCGLPTLVTVWRLTQPLYLAGQRAVLAAALRTG